jgi:hypothetical protein
MPIELLRAEDLLFLQVETENLRLYAADPKNPKLVVDKPADPAYLVVTFPPQSIAEKAYFEQSVNVPGNPPFNSGAHPLPLPVALDPAGQVRFGWLG